MGDQSDRERIDKQNEISRRWKAANRDRARAIGRGVYHRRQRKLGLESAERVPVSEEDKKKRRRDYQRKWREEWRKNPENARKAQEANKKYYDANRTHYQARAREWYWAHRDEQLAQLKATQPMRTYGITQEQYEALGKACHICGATETSGKKKRLHIDHCHATDKIRGLLCGGCNIGIGHLRHNSDLLRKAADYCERV